MEVEEAIRRLRVVRRFSNEPVSDDDVDAILEAGRRTGSSKNSQEWHFIVVRDRDLLADLATVGDYAAHLAGANVAIALLTPDPAHSSETTKAQKPLAAAEVQVEEVEGNPGYYSAKFFLRPHYQLEGLTVSLRLVSKLPSAKTA